MDSSFFRDNCIKEQNSINLALMLDKDILLPWGITWTSILIQ
ncbi:unnamed protein product [Tenebrio molitor]|nr:unnamed protein product [Tenebrio molitor]